MFVIALLSTLALVAEDDLRTDNVISPVALLLTLVLPMWLTSFVGTWFDFLVPNAGLPLNATYVLVNLAWGAVLCAKAGRLFPGVAATWFGRSRGLLLLRIVLVLVLLVALFFPDMRRRSGGMSNMLLGVSIVAMMIVCARQLWRHDVRPGRCHVAGYAMKFGVFVGFLIVSIVALLFFQDTVINVLEDPAGSRMHNKACIFLGTFDSHDMWHLLSAIALALWVLVLLEAQTRIFKRRLPVVLPSLQQHLRNAQCPSTVVLPVVLPSWPSQAPAAPSPSGAASFSVGDPHPTKS